MSSRWTGGAPSKPGVRAGTRSAARGLSLWFDGDDSPANPTSKRKTQLDGDFAVVGAGAAHGTGAASQAEVLAEIGRRQIAVGGA